MAEPLPILREELDLLHGPHLPDGQPTWTLHDPLRNQFFQLDWPSLPSSEPKNCQSLFTESSGGLPMSA